MICNVFHVLRSWHDCMCACDACYLTLRVLDVAFVPVELASSRLNTPARARIHTHVVGRWTKNAYMGTDTEEATGPLAVDVTPGGAILTAVKADMENLTSTLLAMAAAVRVVALSMPQENVKAAQNLIRYLFKVRAPRAVLKGPVSVPRRER